MEDEVLKVEGMKCHSDGNKAELALIELVGITSATADHAAGTVEVTYDPSLVDHDAVIDAIEDAGFEVVA
jgi:copper chaperone